MTGHRAIIGLSLLCAFVFSAFAAQSATAQVGTKSTNTTAVTCVKGGGEDFEDPHCDEKVEAGTGEYGHVAIANDITAELEVSQEGASKLNGTLAGVNTEVTCNTVASVPEKSFIHNVPTETKNHTVTGTVQVNLTECTVIKPPKGCNVKEPVVLTATFQGVEGLNKEGEMGIEFVGEGEKTFAELTFVNKGEEKCSLINGGKPFLLKGSMIATGNVAQVNKENGATWVLEDANEMETLEIGLKKASFASTFTMRTAGCGGNPVAFTTVT
jgi:hypothetical protein